MPESTPHHIRNVYVSKLFGRYTYRLPAEGEGLSDLNILYAENGRGKTTLLSLIFHLLSPGQHKNHKELISTTPFQEIRVTLEDGTQISAEKDEQLLTGPVKFRLARGDAITEWHYLPNSPAQVRVEELPDSINVDMLPPQLQEEVKQSLAQRKYFNELGELKVACFMLTSDRILLGDTIETPDRDRRRVGLDAQNRIRISELVYEQRVAAVTQAMASASQWLQKKYVERSYGAAESSSRVYETVISRIARTPYKTSAGLSATQQTKLRESLTNKIRELNAKSRDYSRFGLAPVSVATALLDIVGSSSGNKLHLINNVLTPHLDELGARIASIEPFYDLVNGFVSNVNGFFKDKRVSYSLRFGLRIFSNEAKETELTPGQLSSGEQQLMLIYCNVLTARDSPSIFIIDEPEISLNILWQRMLVSSLQELAKGSATQFLFASHSMEILAKHRTRVISLEES